MRFNLMKVAPPLIFSMMLTAPPCIHPFMPEESLLNVYLASCHISNESLQALSSAYAMPLASDLLALAS